MADDGFGGVTLASEPLCVADFRVEGGIITMGRSPFGEQRVGYVSGRIVRRPASERRNPARWRQLAAEAARS